MARGWESKSVAEQIESEPLQENKPEAKRLRPEQADRHRRKQNLLLSRKQVMNQLESCHNPLYQELLNRALADLDRQIATLQ